MKGNSTPGAQVAFATPSEALLAFDSLPREVRHAVMYAIVPYYTIDILSDVRRYGKKIAIRRIEASERQDIRDMAAEYRKQTGTEYPHVAAEATILRG